MNGKPKVQYKIKERIQFSTHSVKAAHVLYELSYNK